MRNRLYLIDGTAFAYRCFYAIRASLTDSRGRPTNAAYGFARILLKVFREEEFSHIAVVFDAPGKTFRDDLYPEYKATRKETPQELIAQFPMIDQLVEAFNIPLLRIEGVEADDVMGTLARRAEQAGFETVLVTGDKDMLQLVGEHVRAYDPAKGDAGQWYTPDEVKARFGVGPEGVVDALGLMGDTADNLPGVRGVGEKTAYKLLESYGSLEGVYTHLDEVKGALRTRLEEGRDMAFLTRRLATIDTAVEIDLDLESCRREEPRPARLAEVFAELAFQSLLEKYLPEAGAEETLDYVLITTAEALDGALAGARASGVFAVEVKGTDEDPMRAEPVGVALCHQAGRACYIPFGHTEAARTPPPKEGELFAEAPVACLPAEQVLAGLKPLLEDPAVGKLGHDLKYSWILLARNGVRMRGIRMDTMVASYLTDASRVRHNLSEVSLQYLKRKMTPVTEPVGKGSKAVTFAQVPLDRACVYACEAADGVWRLAETFQPLLRERGVETLFAEMERPLIEVLARMEMAGVAIDPALFVALNREVTTRLEALEAEIYESAGQPFQINSPKQLQAVLFDRLGLAPGRKTKTGYSTDMEVLEELAREHPLPAKVLEYRMLEKLRGTYIEALPKLVHPVTGRIHTSFNQAVTATGRLSSSNPNLQNIPVRTEIGRRIREGFIARAPDYRLVSADYSQIELRVLAHLSGDGGLRAAFHHDADIHRETAARVFGVSPDAVTADMRRQVKAVNFGIIYGISAYGLARNLGITTGEAARFIDSYFAQYPGVSRWIEATLEQARADGYVTTLLNRRRYVPDLKSSRTAARKAAERIAINTPVQGSAADIIKLAMVRLDGALEATGARLLLQVHDELLVECLAAETDAVARLVKETMERAVTLDVPVKADVATGRNWAEIH